MDEINLLIQDQLLEDDHPMITPGENPSARRISLREMGPQSKPPQNVPDAQDIPMLRIVIITVGTRGDVQVRS